MMTAARRQLRDEAGTMEEAREYDTAQVRNQAVPFYAEADLARTRRNRKRCIVLRMVFASLTVMLGVIMIGMASTGAIGWFIATLTSLGATLVAHIAVLNFDMEVSALEATVARVRERSPSL